VDIHRRERLIDRSGIRRVFTPRTPIHSNYLLVGRQDQLAQIVGGLREPGGHAVIFGDRGVGKTSLANCVSEHFKKSLGQEFVHFERCDSESTFISLISAALTRVGVDLQVRERISTHEQGGDAGLSVGIAKAEIASKRAVSTTESGEYAQITPAWAATRLASYPGLLIIDELDIVSSDQTVVSVATFIKQLSDRRAPLKICIVGIADTVARLLRGHQSSSRSLVESKLGRMHVRELKEVILAGEMRTELRFDDDVVDEIVAVSAGYPYFTHLLALKSAEVAVLDGRRRVVASDLDLAWESAVRDTEESLRHVYVRAISYDDGSLAAKVLIASSEVDKTEIHLSEFSRRFFGTGVSSTPEQVRSCLDSLLKDGSVVSQLDQLVFKFVDPRMPSFIKMHHRALRNGAQSDKRT
jgi:hypothetical protein